MVGIRFKVRWPTALGIGAALLFVAVPLVLFLVWQASMYGCGPGISAPGIAARDLAAFNAVLASNAAFNGLRATAVHGHEVDVTDANAHDGEFEIRHGVQDPFRYSEVGGVSDKLRDAWTATFVQLHPHAWNARTVTIDVYDKNGNFAIGISVPQCAMP